MQFLSLPVERKVSLFIYLSCVVNVKRRIGSLYLYAGNTEREKSSHLCG